MRVKAIQERKTTCSTFLLEERATPPRSAVSERQVKKLKCRGKNEWIKLSYCPRIKAALSAISDSEAKMRKVGVKVSTVATFPFKLPVGGLTPIRMQERTRREATRVEGVVPVGSIKRYDSAPRIMTGAGLWSDRRRVKKAATAKGMYSFLEEKPLRERSQLTK